MEIKLPTENWIADDEAVLDATLEVKPETKAEEVKPEAKVETAEKPEEKTSPDKSKDNAASDLSIEQEDTPITLFDEYKTSFGLQGEYEASEQGIKDLLSDVVTSEKFKEPIINEFYENNLAHKALKEHLEQGYGLDSFIDSINAIDYSKIELTENNLEASKQLYANYLKAKGTEDDLIQDLLDTAETKGDEYLLEKGKVALAGLDKIQRESIVAKANKEKKDLLDAKEAEKKEWEQVKSTLSTGKVKGVELSKDEQKDLFDYANKPTKNGKTQREIDMESATIEEELFLDYIRKNKYNITLKGQSPDNAAKKTKVDSVREILKKNNDRVRPALDGGANPEVEEEVSGSEMRSIFQRMKN